jgi:hypothetical protein
VTRAYHFVGDTLRDGSAIPADGEWLEVSAPLQMCEHGLHWSRDPFDALQYAPGNTLCLVDADGEIAEQADKGCSTRRRIICRADAEPMLFEFARWAALQVIHLWDAPKVVRDFLETGDESLRDAARAAARDAARAAARDAARDAARAAAWAAARDAAWAAARAAARAAQRKEFKRRVDELLTVA